MGSKLNIVRQQRRWAKATGMRPDSQGFLQSIEQNLRLPLSPAILADFQRDRATELRRRAHAPPKLCALHSSAALVINMFAPWNPQNAAPLLRALGLTSTLAALTFEKQFPIGIEGSPPNVDAALELSCGSVVGIESKFTEWLEPRRTNKPAFKTKYFDGDIQLWERNGLPHCQTLAAQLMLGERRFRHLDAAQLLKHALGMATQHPQAFALHYLYYDAACAAAAAHRDDILRFADAVGEEIRFVALTYQELYRNLCTPDADAEYLKYLADRYFHLPGD